MNQPEVSIIIPVYNAEAYIAETIRSVQQQTFSQWELIILIDGATDGSERIVSEFLYDKRILMFVKSNTGVSDTRNKGFEKAKGNYIALLDADDIWLPDNLEKKINALHETSADWVYSDYEEIYPDGKLIARRFHLPQNPLQSLLLWEGNIVTAPSGLIFRRKCLESGLRFDTAFSTAADQDFCIQLASSFVPCHVPIILWQYRILENSMSRNIVRMESDHIAVFQKARNTGLMSNVKFRRICFANLYLILAGSWWKNGKNKIKGIKFILKSFFTHPKPLLTKLLCRKK